LSLIRKAASGAIDWRFIFDKWVLGRHGSRRAKSPISELPVKNFLKRLPRGDVFVDIGANVGDYAVLLHERYQITIAVEPFPDTMKVLEKRISGSRIIPVQSALCEFDGETDLHVNKPPYTTIGMIGPRTGSVDTIEPEFHFRPASSPNTDVTWKEVEELPKIMVRAQRFDSMIAALVERDYRIDLVKIDVEGAEFRVLEGAQDSLQHRIKRIVVELHDRERKKELEDTLLDNGFSTHWLDLDHIYGSKPI
jgi:FkbM family methyltransferase